MKIKVYDFTPTKIELEVKELTQAQKKYIERIEKYKRTTRKIPTIRVICKIVGVSSPATGYAMMQRLKEKGYDFKKVCYGKVNNN